MEKRIIKRYEYELNETIREDAEVSIFIARRHERIYSFREYHSADAYISDIAKYKRLQKAGINVPKLIANDREDRILIFERFTEETALSVMAKRELPELYFQQIFNIYRFCRFSKIDIDYMPENFILKGTTLYYIGDDTYEADVKHNLENFGLRYWVYSREAMDHLQSKGYTVDSKRLLSEEETNKRIVLLSVTYW
jgi:hypothetical protein